MNLDQIIARMDKLGVIARQRMEMIAHYPEKSYAEIMHMTQDELEEMLQLRLMLPKESRQTIHERCLERTKRIREKVLTQSDQRQIMIPLKQTTPRRKST